MGPLERLNLVAARLLRDRDDPRHTVLEVADDFLSATAHLDPFPGSIHGELTELRAEVTAVRPRFASHPKTSVLFDEEGLGQPGRERARTIANRIVAVVRLVAGER